MKLINRKSKKTFKNKDGIEKHYYNLYLELDNGIRVLINTVNADDRKMLTALATYEE